MAALKQDKYSKQRCVFISGPGGVGILQFYSDTLKLFRHSANNNRT